MTEYNYMAIKELAKNQNCSIQDLLALASTNDPFYTGRPAELQAAHWFTDLWGRFGYSAGIHLRRIHYQIVSQDPPIGRPDGRIYENTQECWAFLTMAGKYARYLGLVDPDAFTDRRNPEAMVYAEFDRFADPEPRYSVETDWSIKHYRLPNLPELGGLPGALPDLPYLAAGGYDEIEQPYLIEIWAEKSTMNDVLEPICRRYSVNYVTGLGEMSITAVRQFLQRVKQAARPARILYISDFDPAGLGMPISVARKIEFYQRNNGCGAYDIALQPIVLTADQVKKYRLPRAPVKDSDKRKGNFEAAYGEGQVELDALEALYPGELAKIVTAEIMRYYDPDLERRAMAEKRRLSEYLSELTSRAKAEYNGDLLALAAEYQALQGEFDKTRAEFSELIKPFAPKIAVYQSRLEAIKAKVNGLYGRLYDDLQQIDVELNAFPLPQARVNGNAYGVLYDSDRDYLTQLRAYKGQRLGEAA